MDTANYRRKNLLEENIEMLDVITFDMETSQMTEEELFALYRDMLDCPSENLSEESIEMLNVITYSMNRDHITEEKVPILDPCAHTFGTKTTEM